MEMPQQREQWFKDHVGIFSGSQIHRLMAGSIDQKLLNEEELSSCIDCINRLPQDGFSQSTGLPYAALVNVMLPDDADRVFTAKEIRYAFKQMNPLSDGLKGYAIEKAIELISVYKEAKQLRSEDVLNGIKREPEAISRLSKALGMPARNTTGDDEIFLRYKDDRIDLGATSDALFFGKASIVAIGEAKCCSKKVHLSYRKINSGQDLFDAENKYYYQMQTEIACADSDTGYFCSYSPEFEGDYEKLQFHYCEIERDQETIDLIIERTKMAMEYRDQYIAQLMEMK